MRKIYQFLIVCLAMLMFASDGSGQTPILFIGRDALGTYASDQDLYDSLVAWGYVGYEGHPDFWDSNGQYNGADYAILDYADYEVVLMNETTDSKALVHFAQDGYPLPCVNLEGFAVAADNDRWAWLNDNTTELFQPATGTADDQVLVIKDNSHYITEPFGLNEEVTWGNPTGTDITASRPVSIKEVNVAYDGKLGKTKALDSEAAFWNLVTVNDIAGSGNRMVFWGISAVGLNGETQDRHYGTADFFTIIKRSLEWALGAGGGGVGMKEVRADRFELTAFPNPASTRVNVRFMVDAPGVSSATLYNMAGQAVDRFSKPVTEGRNFLYLDATKYPAGIYQLHLEVDGESAVTKVVIQ